MLSKIQYTLQYDYRMFIATTGRSTRNCNCTVPLLHRVTENGAKARVRRGRERGGAGTGGVNVASIGACNKAAWIYNLE
jgi:hypothetical protein